MTKTCSAHPVNEGEYHKVPCTFFGWNMFLCQTLHTIAVVIPRICQPHRPAGNRTIATIVIAIIVPAKILQLARGGEWKPDRWAKNQCLMLQNDICVDSVHAAIFVGILTIFWICIILPSMLSNQYFLRFLRKGTGMCVFPAVDWYTDSISNKLNISGCTS